MDIIFCKKPNIWSLGIRFLTKSKFSHCALLHEGEVCEATFHKGVIKRSFKEFCNDYKDYELFFVENVDEDKAWQWAMQQIGKPYDFWALIGWFFRVDTWYQENKFFCSEFITQAIYNGGLKIFRKSADRVTPQDLLNLEIVVPYLNMSFY